jgi:uncharacterized membrane protein
VVERRRASTTKALEDRVRELEERLAVAERRVDLLSPPTFTPTAPAMSAVPSLTPAPVPSAPSFAPTPPRDLERTIGANWLAKIGMVILVLGVVFFLNYAFQQGWISVPMRIVLGAAGGAVLAVVGDLLRRRDGTRFNAYGQILLGGGAAITYFSLYAAYAFPKYRAATGMSLEVDAVLLGIWAFALGLYATLRRTPVLAGEAVSLAFLASIVGDHILGFSVLYLVLWSGAAVGAASWRRWPWVLAGSVVVSFLNLWLIAALGIDPRLVMAGAAALLGVFTISLWFMRGVPDELAPIMTGLGLVSWLAPWGFALWAIDALAARPALPQGLTTAGLAVAAIGLALQSWFGRPARWGLAAGGIVMALAWPPIQFDGIPTPIAWAAIAAVCVVANHLRAHATLRVATVAAGFLIVVHLASDEVPRLDGNRLDPWLGLIPFALATVVMLGAWATTRAPRAAPEDRACLALGLVPPLLYTAVILDGFAISIAWAVEGVAALGIGFAAGLRDLRVAALGLFALVLGRIFLVDLLVLDIALRIVTFLVVGGLLLLASFLYARRQRPTVVLQNAAKL